jgi:endoglucanase
LPTMRFVSILLAAATASIAVAAPVEKRAKRFKFFGVNESGPEFGNKNFPGVKGKDYVWPTFSTIDVSTELDCPSSDGH